MIDVLIQLPSRDYLAASLQAVFENRWFS